MFKGNVWFNGQQLDGAAKVFATGNSANSTIKHTFMVMRCERKTILSSRIMRNLRGENAGQICYLQPKENKKSAAAIFRKGNSIPMQVVTSLKETDSRIIASLMWKYGDDGKKQTEETAMHKTTLKNHKWTFYAFQCIDESILSWNNVKPAMQNHGSFTKTVKPIRNRDSVGLNMKITVKCDLWHDHILLKIACLFEAEILEWNN